jgi:hypothetical protein
MINKYNLTVCAIFLSSIVFGQVFTNKEVGKKNKVLIDSLEQTEYPYSLPIWGAKATKAGYDLPYSAGVSVQYFWQESAIVINNLNVGFNNGPMYNLDEIVRFDDAIATAQAITVRPDVWVFPFLNVYGILGSAAASTQVDFGIYVPDPEGPAREIIETGTLVEFQTATYGFGITPTIGVGGGFFALDMNVTWTDVPQLDAPAFTFVFGPRIGKSFKFKKPEQNIAVWVGGFRIHTRSNTSGSINLNEIINTEGLQEKVDNGIIKVGDAQVQADSWWDGLSPKEQRDPVNVAKYEASNRALGKAGGILSSADQALNDGNSATVQYQMDKELKDMWNFIIGSQYQLNKHWMLRGEAGFLASRTQVMVGLQYRFGL